VKTSNFCSSRDFSARSFDSLSGTKNFVLAITASLRF
jgi:hypothetical protein